MIKRHTFTFNWMVNVRRGRRQIALTVGVFAVLLGLWCLPIGTSGFAQAQAQGLSTQQIDEIAHKVVLIAALEDGDIISTGSGTIVDSSGLIFTNQHVVADADDYMILILEDINERPEHQYFASVIAEFEDLDFAVLQIDRDRRGRAIDPDDLDLPYLEVDPDVEVVRGDKVYVFGYPGIGDGYLVLTEGAVTTVQNGNIGGRSLPVWYQIDAEISPGSSGGLVVNARGQFVGIPTAVATDDRTLGRLGGVLPIRAIAATLREESGDSRVETNPDQALSIEITHIEYDVRMGEDEELGLQIFTTIRASGFRGQELRVAVFFFDEDGEALSGADASVSYRTPSGNLTVQSVIQPRYRETEWTDYWFWIPYSSFPGSSRRQEGLVQAAIGINGEQRPIVQSNTLEFSFTRSEDVAASGPRENATGAFAITITRIEHNVEVGGRAGMRIYANMRAQGVRGRSVRVEVFFYWEDGDAIPDGDHPGEMLSISEVLTARFNTTEWTDYVFWIPYASFPHGLRGRQRAFVEAQIGLEGESAAARSNQEPFVLNYPE